MNTIDIAVLERIKPGAKVRVQDEHGSFEGLVLARKHGSEAGASFTVRAVVKGVGVEKVYPIHSPAIQKIHVISSPKKVHRGKLYFVRKISGSSIRKRLGVSL